MGTQPDGTWRWDPIDADALTLGESTIPRYAMMSTRALASQALHLAYFTATKTETVTQTRVLCTTGAGATPSLIRIGVWTADNAGALLAQVGATTSDTALLAAAQVYTKAFTASFVKRAGQRYGVGILVVTAASAPAVASFAGSGTTSEFALVQPILSGFVSGQADLPSTLVAASVAATATPVYAVLLP